MPVLKKRAQGDGRINGGLYIHSSPPRVLQLNSAHVKQLIRGGDVDKLEQAVLEGQGKKLIGEYSADYKTRTFLKSIPALMSKISLLHDAVNSGRLEEIEAILEEEPEKKKKLVLAKDESGVGLLHKAVYYDLKDIYKWLIEKFPHTVSLRDAEGRTAYHYTPMCKDSQGVQKLLRNAGADPSILDVFQHSTKYYMEHKQDLELPDSQKTTSSKRRSSSNKESLNFKKSNIRIWIHQRNLTNLQQVVWEGHGSKLLVEHSNNPRIKKFLEAVPHIMGLIKEVHLDVQNGDLDGLKKHASPPIPPIVLSGKDANGLTALHKAVGLGKDDIAEYIVNEYPNSVNIIDNEGRTPLHYAALLKDDGKMTKFLIEHGADESALDNKQKTAAYYKTRNSELDSKLLSAIPECPRTAKESFAANFDWSMLTSPAVNGVKNAIKKVENIIGDTPENSNAEEKKDEEKSPKEESVGPGENTSELGNSNGQESNTTTDDVGKDDVKVEEPVDEVEKKEDTVNVTEQIVDNKEENPNEEGVNIVQEEEKQEALDDTDEPNGKNENDSRENEVVTEKKENTEIENENLENNINETEFTQVVEDTKQPAPEEETKALENNTNEDTTQPDQSKESDALIKETKDNGIPEEAKDTTDVVLNELEPPKSRPSSTINTRTRPNSRNIDKSRPNSKTIETDENQNEKNKSPDPVVEGEGVIEGVVNGEDEVETLNNEGQNQRNGSSADSNDDIKTLVESGNMEQLAALVLNGEGDKLVGQTSDNPELQSFLENVPVYMSKINRIHDAARSGSLRDLQAALDRRKFAIAKDSISPKGASPLHVAVAFGNTSIVRYLAGRFPETVQVVDDDGRTPLHYAAVLADNGHYYNLLVHLGADTRIQDKFGNAAEYYRKNQDEFSHNSLLKEFGVDDDVAEGIFSDKDNNVQAENGQVDMPFFATEEGRYLASSLGDPLIKGLTEVANKRPEDPIAYLAQYLYNFANTRSNIKSRGRTQESQQQVISGSPLAVNDNNAVPATIDVVTIEPDENNTEEESAFNSTTRDEHGQSMLHFAAARAHGRNALFQLLLETEINVAYRDELYRTARDISIQANIPENTVEIDRYVLHIATKGDTDKLVELLLDGYDHITDIIDDEDIPIMEAVSKADQPDTVSFLQSILAFEEKRERVHHAIRQGSINDVTTLLADENDTGSGKLLAIGKNSYGRCTLHIAVLCQQEEIVDYLANTFPDTLKLGDNLERTALHYSMGVEKMETISRVLIKAGAMRVAKDLKGRQPTYYFLNKSDILRLQEEEETF